MFQKLLIGETAGIDYVLLTIYTVGIALSVIACARVLLVVRSIRKERNDNDDASHQVENSALITVLCFLISYLIFYVNLFVNEYYFGATWLVVTAVASLRLMFVLDNQRRIIAKIPDLKELRRMFRIVQVLENANKFGYWSLDLATKKIEWSAGMYNIYELTEEPTLEKIDALVHPDDLPMILAHRKNITKRYAPFEYRILVNGRIRHCRATTQLDDKKKPRLMFGSVMDVTHEVVAKQAAELRAEILQAELLKYLSQEAIENIKKAIWKN